MQRQPEGASIVIAASDSVSPLSPGLSKQDISEEACSRPSCKHTPADSLQNCSWDLLATFYSFTFVPSLVFTEV